MNWLTNFVKPKIQAFIRSQENTENLWTKCPSCEHMLFHRDLKDNHHVCHHCNYHFRLPIKERLSLLFDHSNYTELNVPTVNADPLKFKDTKKYSDRLKEYRSKTGYQDCVISAYGYINGKNVVISVFDFGFMGGSMGMHAGNAILTGSEYAIKTRSPFIVITSSGGARMQEGILSLMQMPRTTIAVERIKEAGLPYITILADPTTGGVSASFAMLGDLAISEPGAIIGFAGARVIEETMRQKLPEGFQKSEFLLDHGMIDMVVHRKELKEKVGKILELLS